MNFSRPMSCRTLLAVAVVLWMGPSLPAQSDTAHYELPLVLVVAASHIGDSWIRLPVAISVVNVGGQQTGRGAGVDEILSGVPGLLAQSRFGNQDVRLSIRGFGSRGAGERSNAGTSRGVRVLLDGFPVTEPDGRTSFDLIDQSSIERVEVVRSNSSTTWGNAAGGVVNFISDSRREAPCLTAQSTFGSFGYRKDVISAYSLIGSGCVGLTFANTISNGWRRHSASSRSFFNAKLISSIGRSSMLEVCLTATSNIFRIPGPLTKAQFDADPQQAQGDPANYKPTYVERDERRFNRLGRLGVKLEHDFDEHTGFAITTFASPKFLQRSERNTFRDFTRYHIGGSALFHRTSEINRKVTNSMVVGLDGAYQDGAVLFYDLADGQRGDTIRADKREGAGNFGAFIENRVTIVDRYLISLRLRYNDITYYYADFLNSKLDDRKSFSRVSPMIGFSIMLDSSRSVYANVSGGVEAPAGNETDPPSTFGEDTLTSLNPLLGPIRSSTVEFGTKSTTPGGHDGLSTRLSYDVSVYLINVSDDIIPYRGGRFYFTAGKTRRLGIEVGCSIELQSGLSLNTSAAFSHNNYVTYSVDSVHYGIPGASADFSGHKMAGVPSVNYSARCRYSPRFAPEVFFEGALQGVGSYCADDANMFVVPAYCTIDLAAGARKLRILRKGPFLQLSLGIRNLLNDRYAASAFINPDRSSSTGEPIYLEPGQPRSWVGSVALKWDL
jgi:iron complex outermembrane receptor protein